MDKKILSFEEYAANKKFSDTEKIAETEVEEVEDEESEDEEPEDEESEDEDEESEDEDEESEDEMNVSEDEMNVSELLKKCYENAIKEACSYDRDEYPDHTLESYLKENAALIATMSANTLEQAHAELKDEALTKEMYEACLNDMKESYNKKMDELKEVWSSK